MTKRNPMTYERGECPQNDRTLSRKSESAGSVCEWLKYPDDNSYETTCNNGAWFEDKLENGVWKFCPHCGLPIKIDNGNEE